MPDLWLDVDVALTEVPVNVLPLIDDGDFKTIEGAVAYNAAGMALFWHFVTTAGVYTVTAVTPTTSGDYDWVDHGASGVYTIEIPASGGASINNDTPGMGWFTGVATGILPWRGPTIGFRDADINDSLIDDPMATTMPAGSINEAVFAADTAKYQAKVVLLDDEAGSEDLYLVTFFKNGQPYTGTVTSPTINVIKASDGTDLVASGALTQVGSTKHYKKTATTTARIVAGSGYIALVGATLDSIAMTWSQPVGRDSA